MAEQLVPFIVLGWLTTGLIYLLRTTTIRNDFIHGRDPARAAVDSTRALLEFLMHAIAITVTALLMVLTEWPAWLVALGGLVALAAGHVWTFLRHARRYEELGLVAR